MENLGEILMPKIKGIKRNRRTLFWQKKRVLKNFCRWRSKSAPVKRRKSAPPSISKSIMTPKKSDHLNVESFDLKN